MTEEGTYQRAINASRFSQSPRRCPGCGSPELELVGNLQCDYSETVCNGEAATKTCSAENVVFEIESIFCRGCNTHWRIEPDEWMVLRGENSALKLELSILRGEFSPASC